MSDKKPKEKDSAAARYCRVIARNVANARPGDPATNRFVGWGWPDLEDDGDVFYVSQVIHGDSEKKPDAEEDE